MKKSLFLLLFLLLNWCITFAQQKNNLSVSGTTFLFNDSLFQYTGISFFNAIYNPSFNKSSQERKKWLEKFKNYGINVLRVWAQWDNKRGFVDANENATIYSKEGNLRPSHIETLKQILTDAGELGMVVELALFSHESWENNIRLAPAQSDKAVAALTRELLPYRNITFQIWNEHSERIQEHVKIIKSIDPKRLVTNSPGFAGVLGSPEENNLLDYLTPHTSRQNAGSTWLIGPQEIAYLIKRYQKPVVDDEPARNGTPQFGGPKDKTYPFDHILQIYQVWQNGGYITYHHDMFQKGYGDPSIPPSGIPDPEFNPYHRQVLEFIAQRKRYQKLSD